jgi:four helix bundle protein
MAVLNYRELTAWQKAMDLAVAVYDGTRRFPTEETYGLRAQVRRAVVSVPCNIAEGQGRKSTKEFMHLLSVAHGSLREVETQLLLAQRLKYLEDGQLELLLRDASEVGRLLNGLWNALSDKGGRA